MLGCDRALDSSERRPKEKICLALQTTGLQQMDV